MIRPAPGGRPGVLMGVFRTARGRSDGLLLFGNTPQAFLTSLAPMAGLLLAGLFQGLLEGAGLKAFLQILPLICLMLTPPVLSYELARLWRREVAWLRFATAMNWCQLVLPVGAVAIMVPVSVLRAAGLSQQAAEALFVLCLGAYALWLHWFIARHGLGISGKRAALLVVGVNLGTALLLFGPRLLVAGRE